MWRVRAAAPEIRLGVDPLLQSRDRSADTGETHLGRMRKTSRPTRSILDGERCLDPGLDVLVGELWDS